MRVFIGLLVTASVVWAEARPTLDQNAGDSSKLANESSELPQAELATKQVVDLQRALARAFEKLAAENELMISRQRELEYADPIAKGLREKLIALEKEVLALRRSLQSRLEAIPEMGAIQDRRQDLLKDIQQLRDLLREVTHSSSSAGDEP